MLVEFYEIFIVFGFLFNLGLYWFGNVFLVGFCGFGLIEGEIGIFVCCFVKFDIIFLLFCIFL